MKKQEQQQEISEGIINILKIDGIELQSSEESMNDLICKLKAMLKDDVLKPFLDTSKADTDLRKARSYI